MAFIPVNGEKTSAFGAGPSSSLVFKECFHSSLSDELEILQHAHMVFSPVSLIKLFDPPAGKVRTVETEFPLPFLAYYHGTGPAISGFVRIINIAPSAFPLLSLKTDAKSTVHAAWSDVFLRQTFGLHFYPIQKYVVFI